MSFQEQLLLVRATLKLSQEGLAKKLDVSYATVSRWELGKSKPTRKAQLLFKNFCKENNICLPAEAKNA